MKLVVLAGGLGTRLVEETLVRPKPMVEIGGRPILWHIMKIYSAYGFNDFIICLGYKGFYIKEFFANYMMHTSDMTFDMQRNSVDHHTRGAEPWRVTVIDTGESTMTGGRLKRVLGHVADEPVFGLTYGDGVADIDIGAQLAFHRAHGKLATVTAIQPPTRFGAMSLEGDRILSFAEKPETDRGWINGGFFLLSPKVGDLIAGDATIWEHEPMNELVAMGEMRAYRHRGFWHPMDTLRDKMFLEQEWAAGTPKWRVW